MKVRCAGLTGPLAFAQPLAIAEAWHSGDLERSFAITETALSAGNYVAGFVSYELGAEIVPRQAKPSESNLPLISLGVYAAPVAAPDPPAERAIVGPLCPGISRSRYRADLATIVAAIGEGDVYQVNYAAPFGFSFSGNPFELYASLTENGRYPYAAYVERDAYALVSCSPELFIRREAGRIVTKPMKGTATPDRREELHGEKNRAEHIMIVDLLRNDLHRLSNAVTVERLMDVETYPDFATMTSTIAAEIEPSLSFEAMLRAMFPCGSITGAPKVAAMRTIAHTEVRPRGIFCGSIGYLAPDRTGIWNVAIRSATIDRYAGRGTLQVGGGIVADSTPEAEWAEILTKRKFFDGIAPDYALIETMLRESDGTFAYLEAHLTRLRAAADDLHFDFDERDIRAALHARATPAHGASAIVIRLQLERNGTFTISERPSAELKEPVDICWSYERVDSTEPLQRYKTTWRPHYEAALSQAGEHGCFDAILCNERDELADCARSNIFVRRGVQLITPPLESGALPGILRSRLIDAGAAEERPIARTDLSPDDEIFIGNSVRGLLRANLTKNS